MDKLPSSVDAAQDLKSYLKHYMNNLENKAAVFKKQMDNDIIVQITEKAEVIEADHDAFQQISSAAEAASQLTLAMRWLQTCHLSSADHPDL